MLFVPKHLVVGLYTPPPGGPGAAAPTMETLNHIWTEVTATYDYRQLQVSPDRTAAVFTGATDSDGVAIEPPLLQVRGPIEMTAARSAQKAKDILAVIGRNLGVEHYTNLGIRHIFHAVVPDGDGRSLVLHHLMRQQPPDVSVLGSAGTVVGGSKFVISPDDGGSHFTLVIEPLFADMTFLFVDLDAQYPRPLQDLDEVTARAAEAESFLTGAVNSFLDRTIERAIDEGR